MKRVWRGRVRDRVWKAFIALAGQDVSTGGLVRRCWPRRQRFEPWMYFRAAAAELADPVARGPGRGWPWLWRLKSDVR
jgi:hypothetical protein